jgi:hypothetical protein
MALDRSLSPNFPFDDPVKIAPAIQTSSWRSPQWPLAVQLHHDSAPVHPTALVQTFRAKCHITQVCQPRYGQDLAPCDSWFFPKAKIAVESEEICVCDGHTVHNLSQRRLTVDWLAPKESDCSRMGSQVSSDWLPSYIKATRPVLEIFKMDGYIPNNPSITPKRRKPLPLHSVKNHKTPENDINSSRHHRFLLYSY